MADEPGRNDPCPCGSGEKYKHCCEGKTEWFSWTTWMIVVAAIALFAGLIAVGQSFSDRDTPDCPPGQVWSEEHGHCH